MNISSRDIGIKKTKIRENETHEYIKHTTNVFLAPTFSANLFQSINDSIERGKEMPTIIPNSFPLNEITKVERLISRY